MRASCATDRTPAVPASLPPALLHGHLQCLTLEDSLLIIPLLLHDKNDVTCIAGGEAKHHREPVGFLLLSRHQL
jgi:hypothetical protein